QALRARRSGYRALAITTIEHTQSCRKPGHRRRVRTPELDSWAWITPSHEEQAKPESLGALAPVEPYCPRPSSGIIKITPSRFRSCWRNDLGLGTTRTS